MTTWIAIHKADGAIHGFGVDEACVRRMLKDAGKRHSSFWIVMLSKTEFERWLSGTYPTLGRVSA